jgi:hypothetical protein
MKATVYVIYGVWEPDSEHVATQSAVNFIRNLEVSITRWPQFLFGP